MKVFCKNFFQLAHEKTFNFFQLWKLEVKKQFSQLSIKTLQFTRFPLHLSQLNFSVSSDLKISTEYSSKKRSLIKPFHDLSDDMLIFTKKMMSEVSQAIKTSISIFRKKLNTEQPFFLSVHACF